MSRRDNSILRTALATGLALAALHSVASAQPHAPKKVKPYQILYKFQGGSDGSNPEGTLVADPSGNLYGTTYSGGTDGDGTVFKVSPGGNETVLYAFQGGLTDGANPISNLVFDSQGNLYGTTSSGGGNGCGGAGCGTVFKLAPGGVETVLHSFGLPGDEAQPTDLIIDGQGNLYGTTRSGGSAADGTVFEVTAGGVESVLYSFQGGSDGESPEGALVTDANGNLYGATGQGGSSNSGVVFELAPNGAETTLHSFAGAPGDGAAAAGSLIFDSRGNLYGTTKSGGTSNIGTVFKLTPGGSETVLYNFTGGSTDGGYPNGGLVLDPSGNLFGTTAQGGGCCSYQGILFELSPGGVENVQFEFTRRSGYLPISGLIEDSSGNLYGTTAYRGSPRQASGVVFKFKPQ